MTKLILSIIFAWFYVSAILIVFWCAFLVFLLQFLHKIFLLLSFEFWLIKLTLIVTVLFLDYPLQSIAVMVFFLTQYIK